MASPGTSKHHKVVIVGAGVNGILAAKTYLQIKPDVDILIIDSEKSIGWCLGATRIYPGLIFELPAPTMNFSDFDICKELGIEKWRDVTGSQFNEFLVCSLPLSSQVCHL
jgi:dimethylaniline monooxygenase (N-oxide forming)